MLIYGCFVHLQLASLLFCSPTVRFVDGGISVPSVGKDEEVLTLTLEGVQVTRMWQAVQEVTLHFYFCNIDENM